MSIVVSARRFSLLLNVSCQRRHFECMNTWRLLKKPNIFVALHSSGFATPRSITFFFAITNWLYKRMFSLIEKLCFSSWRSIYFFSSIFSFVIKSVIIDIRLFFIKITFFIIVKPFYSFLFHVFLTWQLFFLYIRYYILFQPYTPSYPIFHFLINQLYFSKRY